MVIICGQLNGSEFSGQKFTMSDLFQAMPVIMVDLKVPTSLEDGIDRMVSQACCLKRRLRIKWSRRWSIFCYGLRGIVENFKKTEDGRPILKRDGIFLASTPRHFLSSL